LLQEKIQSEHIYGNRYKKNAVRVKLSENRKIIVMMPKRPHKKTKYGVSVERAIERTLLMNIFCFDKSAFEIL
jgi:hypothetical protein